VGKTADRKPGSYPPRLAQVCDFETLTPAEPEAVLAATDVGNVCDIGRRISAKLGESGIETVLDFVRADAAAIRKKFSVVLEKTLRELRGASCLEMSDVEGAPAAKQQIPVSRSLGKAIPQPSGIVEAISEFASRVAEKLRHQQSAAGAVGVFSCWSISSRCRSTKASSTSSRHRRGNLAPKGPNTDSGKPMRNVISSTSSPTPFSTLPSWRLSSLRLLLSRSRPLQACAWLGRRWT
jgi:nucleotidyltransferase/DNA polymerase involved in DNA repair